MSEPTFGGTRTQTPSVFKWLLNERAMLVGEIAELRRQQARLEPSIAGLLAKVEALDKTCALLNDQVEPGAGGAVKAWAGRYGDRGALQAFVLEQLSLAGAPGLDMKLLAYRTVAHFQLEFNTALEFQRFTRNTLRHVLIHLRAIGKAEPLHLAQSVGPASVWRLSQAPTLAGLVARAAARGEVGADAGDKGNPGADANTSGREVAAQ